MPVDEDNSRLPVPSQGLPPVAVGGAGPTIATLEAFETPAPGLREYVNIFRRRRAAILISLGAIFGLSILITLLTPKTYEARATLLISEAHAGTSPSSENGVPASMAAMGSPNLDTHVQLVLGALTAEETAKWLRENGGPVLSPAVLRKSVVAKAVRDTQLVRISARARTTDDAQKIANATATTYVRMNRQRARGSSESTGRYLTEQLEIAKGNLTRAESELQAYKESTGTVASDAAASELLARAASLRADVGKTGADLGQSQARVSRIRDQLAKQNMSIRSGQVRDNAVIQQLRAKLAELEGQRLAAQARYTAEYRGPLNQIDEQIRLVQEQLDEEIRRIVGGGTGDLELQQSLTGQLIQGEVEVAALRARHQQLRGDLARANRELGKIPARQVTLAGLQRQVDVAQKIYSDLLQRSQQIEVGRVMALGNADIVEPATMPRLPVKPNVPLNLVLGILLGLGVGVGVALVQDQLDDTVRDQSEAARLADAPVLGAIPAFERETARPALTSGGPQAVAVEAYRALRYCLDFVTQGERGRVILVTSPGQFEGKSTTVLNLARAVSLTGRRVILVDTDLRRSGLGRMVGAKGEKGVTDVLMGQASLQEALQRCREPGLRFLGSGKQVPHPTELLDSAAMRDLVAGLREEADLIIFDSPPVLAVADSLVLASLSDAVLMVCVAGQSHRYDLQLARGLLSRVGERVSGVVLNKLGEKAGYGYGDRQHYYGKYE
jgi:capsular exopolysaccharide synthesis family protein